MSFLCELCDRSIIENQSECMNYLATMLKKNDKSSSKRYTINNINLDEVDKTLNDYVTLHKKNLVFILSIVNL